MSDVDLEELLADPDVQGALAMLARSDTREVCPECGARRVPDGAEFCSDCAKVRHTASKGSWWSRQADYSQHLADGHRPVHAAKRWLAHRLRRGSVRSSTVKADADRAGIADKTLRRAREQLQDVGRLVVEHEGRDGGGHATRWRLTSLEERVEGAQVGTITEGDGDRLAAPDDDVDVEEDRR